METFWNPQDYGKLDFLVGLLTNDIEQTMEVVRSDLSDYINGIESICRSHVDEGSDRDGVYKSIICAHFCSGCVEEEDCASEEDVESFGCDEEADEDEDCSCEEDV